MTVSVTISSQSQGDPLEEVTDFGEFSPGEASDLANLYIRHDAAVWQITDCGFYLVRYVGSQYPESGGAGPDADFATVIGWGDNTIADNPAANGVESNPPGITDPEYGGFYLNMNHQDNVGGKFPPVDWHPFYSGYGDSPENAVVLSQKAINNLGSGWIPADGEIPFQGEAHVQVRWDIPISASDAGISFIQLVMAYSYTS
jgi:hypothetical protein